MKTGLLLLAGSPRSPHHDQAAPQTGRLPGLFSGKPMPDYPFPLPIWDFPNDDEGRNEDRDDWLAGLLRITGASKGI